MLGQMSRFGLLRTALRPLASPAIAPGFRYATPIMATRAFAAKAASKPKFEDPTLQGRYATALFAASATKLDKVMDDLAQLRSFMTESSDFKLFIETPGVTQDDKVKVLENLATKIKLDDTTVNFLKVLIENKRIGLLLKAIDSYEAMYRAEKGQVLCKITSAAALTDAVKKQVFAAMQKRAGANAQLIMDYEVNPALLGGLVVKMGDAVFDYSVSTKIDRLTNQLLAPVG